MEKFLNILRTTRPFLLAFSVVLTILVTAFPPSLAIALSGTPPVLSYQGRLTDGSGNLLGGAGTTYYFKFSIWDGSTVGGGNRLWPAALPATTTATVRQGVFNVNIGDTANGYPQALDLNFNTNRDIYLQVEVSSDNNSSETLSPRQRISAASFAALAGAVSGTTTPSTFGTTSPIGSSVVTIESTSTASIPLSIRAIASQVANLFNVEDASGLKLFSVNSSGGLLANSASSTITNLTAVNATTTNATTTNLAVTGNGVFSSALTVTGLSTLSGGILANSASSTIANLTVSNATSTNATTTTFAVIG
ncbi:hypothetical protein KW797_04485, partial [Candidatus Parcubacteria bacterium]|nr:hypothetical protein [Candidatus Parcubacteria bacterium]